MTALLPWEDPSLGLDPSEPDPADSYDAMLGSLRGFLDHVAAAKLSDDLAAELTSDLRTWRTRLAAMAVSEQEQTFSRRFDLPGRGQTFSAPVAIHHVDPELLEGSVRFGRYFLGRNGAAHGGVVSMTMDEVLARLSIVGQRGPARTAHLKTSFRSITPVGVDLAVRAWFVAEEGRKRIFRAEVRHGETLCVEAEALFVTLRPGQP